MDKVFVVGRQKGYASWLLYYGFSLTSNIEESDLVMFTGGEDVQPLLYLENVGKHTYFTVERDLYEIAYYNIAISLGKPMIGICRGGQLLTVLNGGRLIQHVNNHSLGFKSEHKVFNESGLICKMNSVHHQMMYPFDLPKDSYKILGWTDYLSDVYLNGENENQTVSDNFVEPEFIHYHKTKSLAIQGHPEAMSIKSDGVEYCYDMLFKMLNNKL